MIVQLTKVRLLLILFAAALVSVLGLSVSQAAPLSSPKLTHPGQPLRAPVTTTTPTATPTPVPVRIQFAPGATSAVVEGDVSFPQRNQYILRALAGQEMSVVITSPGGAANFAFQGVSDGQPYKRLENEDRHWTGILPLSQDYLFSVAVAEGTSHYALHISIITPVVPTPTPTSIWKAPANPIELFSPVSAGIYHSPIEITGFSQTFEGVVNLRLSTEDGTPLAKRNAMGGSVDGFDFFHTYLLFTVSTPISATLEVFETSAADGSEIHKITIPLRLLPGQRVIDVNAPGVGATVCSPVTINGYSDTFEATLAAVLTARNGTVITQTSTMGGNLGVYADFTASLAYTVATPQPVLAGAYEGAASGLGLVDQTLIPVSLFPAGSSHCP